MTDPQPPQDESPEHGGHPEPSPLSAPGRPPAWHLGAPLPPPAPTWRGLGADPLPTPDPGPAPGPAAPIDAEAGGAVTHDAGTHDADIHDPTRRRGTRDLLVAGLVGGVVGALLAAGIVVAVDDDTSSPAPSLATAPVSRPSRALERPGDISTILASDVPAVVAIVADGGPAQGGSAGTGFVISEDGVIATNHHVVEGAGRIDARFSDGTALPATVLGDDANGDLAVLHVDAAGLPTIELGDSTTVQVGDDVVAIGNALALEGGLSVTRGIVSGLDRTVPTRSGTALVGAIQTDAAINPGNSGGPLVDSRGRVIGINTAIADPSGAQNVGFAIPISQAKPVFDALRAGTRPAYLGVTVDTASNAAGAAVRDVGADTPAARAGVRAGDVIVTLGGRAVTSWEELRPAIREQNVGDTVDLVVERNGQRVTLQVTLEEDPRTG